MRRDTKYSMGVTAACIAAFGLALFIAWVMTGVVYG